MLEKFKIDNKKSLIIGMLLGDAWVTFNRKTAILSYYHSPKQEEYIKFKKGLLETIGYECKLTYSPKTKNNYPKYKLWTKAYRSLNLYRLMYSFRNTPGKRKKRIVKSMLNRLDEFGLALWFMDDGYNNPTRNYMHLATYCFSLEENELIKDFFKSRWDIDTKIYRRKNQYFLVWYKDAPKLKEILKPYISLVPSMLYKIE